ncbi:uncharacterized protein LOC135809271 [Sycon ciliatum]|uniref:uncharacterized protein LOC135809271 n=1 Tax=Sycon ciliatum TaxID=27933 RepID=UPI0031F708B4
MDDHDDHERHRKCRAVAAIVAAAVALVAKPVNASGSSSTRSLEEMIYLAVCGDPDCAAVFDIPLPRRTSVPRQVGYFEHVIPLQSDMDFRSHFRLCRQTVDIVVDAIRASEHMQVDVTASGKDMIDVKKQVLLTLWWLGSKSCIREVSDKFGLSKYTIWTSTRRVCFALCDIAPLMICWPKEKGVNDTQGRFHQLKGIHGIIGAIDGSHIPIKAPMESTDAYLNRKRFHSIVLQAVCDANLLFTDVFAGWPGSVHDARVFNNSPLKHAVDERKEEFFPMESFILGDSAYPLLPWLITPYRDAGNNGISISIIHLPVW